MPRILICIAILCAAIATPHAEETTAKPEWGNFQWSFKLDIGLDPRRRVERSSTAYLWVPPKTEKVKGVLVGGRILMEGALVRDPRIRQVCIENDLAIVYFNGHFDAVFNYGQANPELMRWAPEMYLETFLDGLGKISGYEEIATVPLIPFGHSVGTLYAQRVGYWKPERTAAIMLLKGGLGNPPGHDPEATLDGIPLLHIQGQFEEFGSKGPLQEGEDRTAGFRACTDNYSKRRQEDPDNTLMGLFIEPGGTHFAWSPALCDVVVPFIEAVAEHRLGGEDPNVPKPMTADQGAYLKADFINVYENGATLPAPVAAKDFEGDPKEMYWYPSIEVAQAVAGYTPALAKKSQFVSGKLPKYPKAPKRKKGEPAPPSSSQYPELQGWGKPMRHGHDNRIYYKPHIRHDWTFELKGAHLDKVPKRYPGEGEPATFSPNGEPKLRVFGGNVTQLDATTFKIHGDWRFGNRFGILAHHEGDDEYRYSAQHLLVKSDRLIRGNRNGKPQRLDFELDTGSGSDTFDVDTITLGDPLPELTAKTESGLPAQFYVDSGPAHVDANGKLVLEEIPVRSAWPIRIKIVAVQLGTVGAPWGFSGHVADDLYIEKPE